MTPEFRDALRSQNAKDPRLSLDQSKQFSRALEQSVRAQWASGPISGLIQGLTLAVTYTLMARAIASDTLGFGYLLLPWVLEYLLIAWIGVLLSRTWVKEPIFVAVSGRIGIALGWTVALLAPYVLVLGGQTLFAVDADSGGVADAWDRVIDSGMVWACAAVSIGLLVDTVHDLAAWRGSDQPFVWPATHRFAFRFAALLAMVFALPFVLALGMAALWVLQAAGVRFEAGATASGDVLLTWLLFVLLLAADLLVLSAGTWMHRRQHRRQHRARRASSSQEGTT